MGATPAAGGDGEGVEAGDGGNGGAGNQPAGAAGATDYDAGGGGGGVGRVRINALSSPVVQGVVSPTAATGAFTTGPLHQVP